jgi:hypothetical protein
MAGESRPRPMGMAIESIAVQRSNGRSKFEDEVNGAVAVDVDVDRGRERGGSRSNADLQARSEPRRSGASSAARPTGALDRSVVVFLGIGVVHRAANAVGDIVVADRLGEVERALERGARGGLVALLAA